MSFSALRNESRSFRRRRLTDGIFYAGGVKRQGYPIEKYFLFFMFLGNMDTVSHLFENQKEERTEAFVFVKQYRNNHKRKKRRVPQNYGTKQNTGKITKSGGSGFAENSPKT